MNAEQIRNGFLTLLLVAMQVLIFNRIHLFGYATPLVYVYVTLVFRRNSSRWLVMLWCFATGLIVDIFSNTPGVAAASMTVAGLLQPYLLPLFVGRDNDADLLPSVRELGLGKYLVYASLLTVIFCLLFFTLETFNFFDWQRWGLCIVSSSALTLLLVLVMESFRKKKRRTR